jgi:hypothetical protein
MSNISSVSSSSPVQPTQRTPEAAEVKKGGRDNDGDADDAGAKAVRPVATPTVNTSGQAIGKTISTTA